MSLAFDPLMNALSELERHTLLECAGTSASMYAFHHALVHQVVYSEISEPRRKLMHLRVARLLHGTPRSRTAALALELAHHAAVGGDAARSRLTRASPPATAACSCSRTPRRYAHARRGLRLVEELPDPERLKLRIELEQLSLEARRPDDPASRGQAPRSPRRGGARRRLRASMPASPSRLVSDLRWQGRRRGRRPPPLTAGGVREPRVTDARARALGIAEAARCLVTLERDIAQAEALLLEARAITERSGESPWVVADALGLLHLHAGELEEASAAFENAWAAARRTSNRLHEFMALEHLVMVSISLGNEDKACQYAKDLGAIGEKLREGSERPLGRAMVALCAYRKDQTESAAELEDGLQALREIDAKQRLAFVLTQAALVESTRGQLERAEARAKESLALGRTLERPTEIALALSLLLRIAIARGDQSAMKKHADELVTVRGYARHVRPIVESELTAAGVALQPDPSEREASE